MEVLIIREGLKRKYSHLKSLVVKRKDQFSKLIDFMESETEWLTTPASTRFHLSKVNGLLEHSVNVAETMIKIKDSIYPEVSDETCVILSLIHDLGKIGMPGNSQYLKNEPSEKQKLYGYKPKYPYRFNKDLVYISVPIRSIYLSLKYIDLSEEEVQAIAYHDGQYVEDNRSVATREEPLTLLLHYADSWSGFVVEKNK